MLLQAMSCHLMSFDVMCCPMSKSKISVRNHFHNQHPKSFSHQLCHVIIMSCHLLFHIQTKQNVSESFPQSTSEIMFLQSISSHELVHIKVKQNMSAFQQSTLQITVLPTRPWNWCHVLFHTEIKLKKKCQNHFHMISKSFTYFLLICYLPFHTKSKQNESEAFSQSTS